MAQTFAYATNEELSQIDQKLLPLLVANDPLLALFPQKPKDTAQVAWEQRDNYTGLQQGRGYNGSPARVPTTGVKKYIMMPSVFGEYDPVDEHEITTRRQVGTMATPIDINDLVIERQEKLMTRQVNRMRWLLATLLVNAQFVVTGKEGQVIAADGYTPQLYSAVTGWSTAATSTPLGDFRAVQIKHRGQSASFGAGAMAFMNQTTFNNMISNTNANDLGGRRTTGLASIEGQEDFNKLALKDNLPQVVIYDEFYNDETDTPITLFADNKVIVIGRRTNNANLGEFILTRNATNPDLSSNPYLHVYDSAQHDGGRPPRRLEVHRGFNGGPAIYYPGAVVVMSV